MLDNSVKYLCLIGSVHNHRNSRCFTKFTKLLFIKKIIASARFEEDKMHFVIVFE